MVRHAVENDIETINKLGLLLNKDFSDLFNMSQIFKEEFAKVFVYVVDAQVVGFLHITELYETIDIINIVVDPEYRRQKIATILLDYMMSETSTAVQIITLEVAVDNTAAINLYKEFGFEIIKTRPSYYNGIDAYLMGKKLIT